MTLIVSLVTGKKTTRRWELMDQPVAADSGISSCYLTKEVGKAGFPLGEQCLPSAGSLKVGHQGQGVFLPNFPK